MSIVLIFVLAWAVERAEIVIEAGNYGARANGFGAVRDVLEKKAQAPMAYRVLYPFIMKWVPEPYWLEAYQILKILGLAFMLWSVSLAWGVPVALGTLALATATFLFDYWDWPIEVGAIALAMTGNVWYSVFGVILLALTKETAPLVAVAYAITSRNWEVGSLLLCWTFVLMVAVRWKMGRKPLYCKRWMISENLTKIGLVVKDRPIFHGAMFISLIYTVLGILAGYYFFPTGLIVWAVLGAGWFLACAEETRVFASILPFVCAFLFSVHI